MMDAINERFGLKTVHLARAGAGCAQTMRDATGAANGGVYDSVGANSGCN